MKKLTYLLLLLLASLSYGQGTPIITMIADGDCSGGNPKVLEIYAHGTVDFSNYTLQKSPNGGSWGNDFNLGALGTVTDDFVYIYNDSSSPQVFSTEFPSVTSNFIDASSSQILSINGDDPVRIIDSNNAVIDVFGDGDGTGLAWEYKDGYAKRIDGTGPDPVFDVNNWMAYNGALNNQGSCQGGTIFESIILIGTYTPPSTSTPILAITSPANNDVFAPNTTDVDIVFTVQNFNVSNGSGDGYIVYSVNNGASVDKYDTTPITLTNLTPGSYSVVMELVDNSGNSLSPAIASTVTFEIATYTQVSTLADLRNGTMGGYYHYTGEAFATAAKLLGNSGTFVGYAQDATAGIAAFVPAGTTGNVVNLGDGITDLKGQLTEYHGVLQLSLIEDFTLTGNNAVQPPQVVTISDYLANSEDYESELIKFENVTIDGNGDTQFQSSTNYDLTDGTDTVILRTNFPDLVGENIPSSTVHVAGIAAEYNGTPQIFPRDINDIESVTSVIENNINGLKVYPNPVSDGLLYISTASNQEKDIFIYNTLGKVVSHTSVLNNQPIHIAHLKAGIYFVRITENKQIAVIKLLIK